MSTLFALYKSSINWHLVLVSFILVYERVNQLCELIMYEEAIFRLIVIDSQSLEKDILIN